MQLPYLQLNRKRNKKKSRPKRDADYLCTEEAPVERCCRYDLLVDFEALGWEYFIIQPKTFHSSYCSGECPYYTAYSSVPRVPVNFENRAVGRGGPCCVPNTYSPLDILVYVSDRIIQYRLYREIISSCACM